MATRALEELDGGLGSGLASEDLSTLADPCPGRPPGDKPPGRWMVQLSQVAHCHRPGLKPGPRLPAAAPRSVPARKKVQALPPPPPPPVLSEELPWGDLSLNKCLVLASLVALLGSAFQLCRDAVTGEGTAPTPAPERWVPRGPPPKEPPKPAVCAPPSVPPAPQAGPPALQGKTEDSPQVSMTKEVAEKAPGEPGEATREAAGKERTPPVDRGPKERPRKEGQRKEERPPKEKVRKEKPRKVERPQKERPQVAREAREALPRRWEAREGGHRPWAPDPRDPEHRKRQVWAPRRHPDIEKDRHPGGQKHRAGKGRG
uniref:Junctional sarcoplasmic reticulum protein 1 n=1 Tax=Sciurus vulgaris TaxID=55149 RepID=A0A8D2DP34_SCIVU